MTPPDRMDAPDHSDQLEQPEPLFPVQLPAQPPEQSPATASTPTTLHEPTFHEPRRGTLKGVGAGKLPPMLEQYVAMRDELDEQFPQTLLLFQCGDFYETFGEDAERAARLLNLTLTHKTSKDFSTAMAGIPLRALDTFTEKLLSQGVRVAIAEQMELAGAGLVERKVTQILSPGTVTEERLLSAEENYLAALATGGGYALALLDMSTGDFRCATFGSRTALYDELSRWQVREVLLCPELGENDALRQDFMRRFPVMLSPAHFDEASCEAALISVLGEVPGVVTQAGAAQEALTRACGAVLSYAAGISAAGEAAPLQMVRRLEYFEVGAQMQLSDHAMRALELFAPQSPQGVTLLQTLGQTRTALGKRRLRSWLRSPLLDRQSLSDRQDALEALLRMPDRRGSLRALLYRAHDLERLAARVMSQRVQPREVAALQRTLTLLPEAQELLSTDAGGLLGTLHNRLSQLPEVCDLIGAALVDDPPLRLSDGGLIREGFHAGLDSLRAEAIAHRTWLADLEHTERERTGISSLKVGYNSVFGYYLEVTAAHLDKVPADYKQVATLKGRARFTRADLREHEREIARLEQAAQKLELEVFTELREQLAQHAEALSEAAGALAEIDVLTTLAELSAERAWVRPQTLPQDAPPEVWLRQARHPVVEQSVGAAFVPNDAQLDPTRRTLLLTGPNMAGKSTYLRTIALCALLHQIGCFVPAEEARLPIFDSIHTRIGASDDLAGGRSTFMVEMSELASILQRATPRSLVILDEVGRGTSTLDGLAIAQAALEHLHAAGAYTLFATHYFELTRLEASMPGLVNLHVAAEEDAQKQGKGGLTFYHQVMPGAARQSYGVEVAKLAGLPVRVTDRAAALLSSLNAREQGEAQHIQAELAALDIGRLTPLEALALLHKWQKGVSGQ